MIEKKLFCIHCLKEIKTTICQEDNEDSFWTDRLNDKYYNLHKECVIPHLESQIDSERKKYFSLLGHTKQKQQQIYKLLEKINKFERFFRKQQSRVNAFAQEVK